MGRVGIRHGALEVEARASVKPQASLTVATEAPQRESFCLLLAMAFTEYEKSTHLIVWSDWNSIDK